MMSFRILIIVALLVIGFGAKSQIVYDTTIASTNDDSYVLDTSPSSNYNTNHSLYTRRVYNGFLNQWQINRSYLKFDLSSIPENAIVLSADLDLEALGVWNSENHPLYLSRADASWSGSSITWNNQPGEITSDQISVPDDSCDATGEQKFEVTDHIQHFVNYPDVNYGWRIRLQSESGSNNKGVRWASSSNGTSSYHPRLYVEYVLPVEVSGYVSHCTNGNDDGSIDASVSEGVGTYDSYAWLKYDGGVGYEIESGTTVDNDEIDVSGLENGLYLLYVEDDSGYIGYQYFLVGEEGTNTDVVFEHDNSDTSSLFNEDAMIRYNSSTGKSDENFDSYTNYYAGDWSDSYDYWSLLRYKADFSDYLIEYDTADLYLTGVSHYRTSNSTNECHVSRVSEAWYEDYVTYDIAPDTTDTNQIVIPETASTGYTGVDDTLDLLNFVSYWQDNSDKNYGIHFGIDTGQADPARRVYESYDGGIQFPSNRPQLKLSFTLKSKLTTAYDDTADVGTITVNAPQAELPYKYLISEEPLPILDSLWDAVKDSIPIDSADFYSGNVNSQNYTFEDLSSGYYYIGVYDNNGTLFHTDSTYLTPDIEIFSSSAHLTVDNDTLEVSGQGQSATATPFLNLPKSKEGGFEMKVANLDDEVLFGFNAVDDAFASTAADFEYAIEILTTGKVYYYKSDSAIDSTTVVKGDLLKAYLDTDSIYFYKNDTLDKTDPITDYITTDLKMDVNLKGPSSKLYITVVLEKLKKPTLKTSITYPPCYGSTGVVDIQMPDETYFGIELTSYTIKDSDENTVASGTETGIEYLEPDVYTIDFIYSIGMTSYYTSEELVIGYPMNWTSLSNMDEISGTVNSIEPNTVGTLGTAQVTNETLPSQLNWIEFEVSAHAAFYTMNYEKLIFEDPGSVAPLTLWIFEPGGYILSKFVVVIDEDETATMWIGDPNPIRVEMTADASSVTDIDVYQNGDVESTLSPITTSGNLTLNTELYGEVIQANTISNFCYERTAYVAKTKNYTDGGFYILNDSLDFQYTGEYNESDLIFELINDQGEEMTVSTDYDIVVTNGSGSLKTNADNRYTLQDNGLSGGFYLLRVTNVKGEEHYIRLQK